MNGRKYNIVRLKDDGTQYKMPMTYGEVCQELGFVSDVNFVEVTTRGTITYSLGKPGEIRALRKACREKGFRMAKSLEHIDV